tara:strand:+ start:202 stop:864 length:663 start_codon:yes stop_codon:yes gene_type:complete
VYNSPSSISSQGIELVCSVADCGTDQTSQWCGSKIENKPVCYKCNRLQRTPPDRVCGASGCGKGVSVVNEWCHSQRDKDNKDLWFCRPCYDKEVRIPRFPQLHHEVTSRNVSLTSRRSIFLFFAFGATHGRSGEDVRELPVYQDMQVAHLRRRTRWQDLPPMPLQRRKPERVPEGVPQDENAEESLSVDDPNPLFPFFETPHDPEPRRNLIRDEARRNKK